MIKLTSSWATTKVREFDGSGVHRIGTPGDIASGEWLLGEASVKDMAVSKMQVVLDRSIIDEAYLECAQRRIEALPLFDAPASAPVDGRPAARRQAYAGLTPTVPVTETTAAPTPDGEVDGWN